MFEHLGREALGETICRRVEIAENCVALTSPHQADGVWDHPSHDESHAPPSTEGARDNVSPKPIDGTAAPKMALMVAMMLSSRICFHLVPLLKLEIGVLLVALFRHRYATW